MKLKVVVGLLVLLILGYTVLGEHGLVRLVRSQKQKNALLEDKQRLESENAELKKEIDRLQNDPDYIERVAREELGMVKKGELVIQFADPDESGAPTSP